MMVAIARALTVGAVLLGSATGQSAAQSSMTSVSDDQLLASYVAYIEKDDLYNSSGDRLTQPWQIIRQDRANFHNFHIRDRWDENDPFFENAENRPAMESMLRNGDIFMSWRDKVASTSGFREADNRLYVISAMLSWAKENRRVFNNHVTGFKRLHSSDRSDLIWLPEHIERS